MRTVLALLVGVMDHIIKWLIHFVQFEEGQGDGEGFSACLRFRVNPIRVGINKTKIAMKANLKIVTRITFLTCYNDGQEVLRELREDQAGISGMELHAFSFC